MKESSYRVPKTEQGMKTFNKIIDAGKCLFSSKGYSAASINEIISEAGVAAGTFYLYFDNKLSLYLYLLDYYKRSIRQTARESIKGLTSRHDIEREGLKSFIKYVYNDPLAYKVVWESLFVDIDIFRDYYIDFSKAYIKNLESAESKKEIKPEIDLETLSYVLMGISNFVGLQILFKDKITDKEIDTIVDNVMKIITEGIFIQK